MANAIEMVGGAIIIIMGLRLGGAVADDARPDALNPDNYEGHYTFDVGSAYCLWPIRAQVYLIYLLFNYVFLKSYAVCLNDELLNSLRHMWSCDGTVRLTQGRRGSSFLSR